MSGFWDRVERKRISRRRLLQATGAAGIGAGALAVVGCSSGDNSGSPAAERTSVAPDQPDILNPAAPPKYGGRLVTANAASFGAWDPHKGIAVASAYFPRIYNVLLSQSASKPEFVFRDLAASYEIPDNNTFVFSIRPGVHIAPNKIGVPERDLDGEDVRTTFERLRSDPATNAYNFAHGHIARVEVDGDTVRIITTEPYAWFLNQVGAYTTTIPPRELLLGDIGTLSKQGAGGGPFTLRSVEEEDSAHFDRNPRYYGSDPANAGAQLPYVDGLDVRVVFDKTTQLAGVKSGQFHQYMTGSSSEARALGDFPVARDPNFTYISFTMNVEQKPFDDPRVRRAISRAINRQQYIDLIYEGDARPDGLVQWSLGSYALPEDELQKWQPFDLDEAKRLVNEVGGISLKMMYPTTTILEHDQHLPIFTRQMEAAGIKVQPDPQDFATWVENVRKINYQCTLNLNQIYETPEFPLNTHTARGPFGDGTFLRGLNDAEITAAIDAVGRELDFDRRVELVREAQRIIYRKDPVSLPLVTPYNHIAWRKEVKDIPTGVGTTAYLLSSFWLDT